MRNTRAKICQERFCDLNTMNELVIGPHLKFAALQLISLKGSILVTIQFKLKTLKIPQNKNKNQSCDQNLNSIKNVGDLLLKSKIPIHIFT